MITKKVSFSLFGDQPKYYVGAEKNVVQIKELLPDWTTVIYYHRNMTQESYISKLTDLGADMIDITDYRLGEKNSNEFPYFWRFIPFTEDTICISRDLDSRMSKREVEYIRRWEDTKEKYFIIRDHPWHSPVPSGLFGIMGEDKEFSEHFKTFINTSSLHWGADQEILYEYIQKVKKEDVLYFGYDKPDTYIPRDDKNFFIGMQLDEFDEPTKPSGEQCLNYLNELNF